MDGRCSKTVQDNRFTIHRRCSCSYDSWQENSDSSTDIYLALEGKSSYAIEVRHKSWFDKDVYRLLSKHGMCLVWSQLDAIQTPPELTTDFFYIRFIGDRSIKEEDFGNIQKERGKEMEYWAKQVKQVQDKLKFGIAAANNHYAGFGPATANMFRKMVRMKPVIWEEMKQATLD